MGENSPVSSPLEEAVSRVGDRWTLLLVDALLAGPRRFGDLQEDLKGIAPNVLSARVRHLAWATTMVGVFSIRAAITRNTY